jgi:uncharacterized protein YhhL (DUF1145 family)
MDRYMLCYIINPLNSTLAEIIIIWHKFIIFLHQMDIINLYTHNDLFLMHNYKGKMSYFDLFIRSYLHQTSW